MAPEVMSSEVYPSSDIWAAGVMTYQLLSGQMPFDDRRRPNSPALSAIWKAILTAEPSFTGKAWMNVSEPAKAFVKRLLNKDPKCRPAAKEALQDPWLRGNSLERNQGQPLDATVVQRIQRYAQTNILKRTIFELIAEELIKTMTDQLAHTPDPSTHGSGHHQDNEAPQVSPVGSLEQATHVGSPVEPPNPSWIPFMSGVRRKRSLAQELTDTSTAAASIPRKVGNSAHGGLEYHRAFGLGSPGAPTSVQESNYWRRLKTAVEAAKQRRASSMHGSHQYMRATAKDRMMERERHRKAARLALDTSAHAGSEYRNFMQDSYKDEEMPSPRAQQGLHRSNSDSAAGAASNSPFGAASRGDSRPPSVGGRQSFQNCPAPEGKAESTATDKATRQVKPPSNAEAGMRGQSQYAQFLHRSSVGPPANQDTDSQPLLRRSSSLGAANKRNAKPSDAQPSSPFAQALATILPGSLRSPTPASGPVEAAVDAAGLDAQKMERQPSRVYAVAAHQSADGDCDSADHVQEAASHREQMLGIGGGQPGGAAGVAYQPQAHPQVERKPPERQLTFQEMLRQQIEAHSHHVSPEEGTTPDPSTHAPSPASTPPASNGCAHVSFQEMLRQQLGQQATPEVPAADPSGHAPAAPRVTYQAMLRQQSYGIPSALPLAAEPIEDGTSSPTVRPDNNTTESSGIEPGVAEAALGGGTEGAGSPGRSQHGSRALVTPVGLRLYDAQGSCSIVPLEELRQMMQKLRFSRDKPGIDVEQLAQGLKGLGFELAPSELSVLMDQASLAQHGHVAKPAFLASQVDWQNFQQNFKDLWLECAQAAFASMDSGDKGHIKSSQLVSLLSTKLPAEEVEHAVEDALMEAGCGDMEDLDFNGFLKLLHVNSMDSLDSLDQYDSRVNSSLNLQSLDSNPSGHGPQDGHYPQLESVPE
ncbi:hypothetical protein ABBQ38_014726 [Trebouxia sp. C0009 RCD-2024]